MVRRFVVLSVLSALVVAGLALPSGATPAERHPNPPGGEARRWWCNANDTLPMTDMTDQQMMDESTFYPTAKGPLSRADCRALTDDLRDARRYAMQYPHARDAVRAGFHMIVAYVHGMGAHYIGPAGIKSTIDPERPNFLLYGGNGPDAPLVGLMWLINSGQAPPPDGLPGGNDHWHRHMKLCFVNNLVVAEGLTDATCAAAGGVNVDTSNLWMLHGWLVPGWEYRPDVFRAHHPMLMDMPPAM